MISENWQPTKLGVAFNVNPKRTIKKGEETPFIPMDSLPENSRSVHKLSHRIFTGSGVSFKNGDVLIARITPCLENGKTAFIECLPENQIAHGSTEYIVISGKDDISDSLFGYYLARSQNFREYAISHMEGTSGRQRVPNESVKQYEILLPPLPEQRRIAEILGSLDDKIELNRQMNNTLEAMAQAIFKSWFVDFDPVRAKMEGRQPIGMDATMAALFPDSMDGDVPRGWRIVSLADFCEKPQYGFTASANDEPIGPKLLRITDINKEPWISWDKVPHCAIPENEFPKYSLNFGDLLIARMADPGHGVLIEEDINAVFASYLIRFRPKEKLFGRYLQYWQKSPLYWEQINALKTGTTRPSLNAPTLSNLEILKPNTNILVAFSSIADKFRTRIIHNVNESRTLSELRDSLLPKLMSGAISL